MKSLLLAASLVAPMSWAETTFHDPQGTTCRSLIQSHSPLPAYPDSVEAFIETDRLFLIKETQNSEIRVYRKSDWRRLDQDVQVVSIGTEMVQIPIVLEPKARGVGYGTEAKTALIQWAFEVLGATRIRDRIYDSNAESLELHRKLGYQFHCVATGGGFYDLTPEEFKKFVLSAP